MRAVTSGTPATPPVRGERRGGLVPWLVALAFALLAAGLGLRSAVRPSVSARVDSAPVVAAMKRILRVATVEVQVVDVVKYEEVKTFFFVDLPKSATLRLRGRVLGGFDLESGFSVRAENERRRLVVDLPRARVLAVDPTIEWFDEKSGLLNPITPEDRTRWTAWGKSALARAARDAGLERKAEEHARALVLELARALGWEAEVRVGGVAVPTPAPSAL